MIDHEIKVHINLQFIIREHYCKFDEFVYFTFFINLIIKLYNNFIHKFYIINYNKPAHKCGCRGGCRCGAKLLLIER